MKSLFVALSIAILAIILSLPCRAASYYVSAGPSASDTNSGSSPDAPFRNPQHAADIAGPGDVVYFMDGTYANGTPDGVIMEIKRSGTPNSWIRFVAMPGAHPVFRSSGWAAVSIHASYIEIRGLDLEGMAETVPLSEAQANEKDGHIARTNGNGISIDGRSDGPNKPHHIVIDGDIVAHFPGGGIAVCQADYLTVADNIVYDNSWYSVYGTSGISLWQCWNYDHSPGYHNRIVRNECFGNANKIPTLAAGEIFTDGNGIILDDSKNTQGSTLGPYRGRTLIANNLCFENGGSGIHTYSSEHADVLNNTCIDNNQTPQINEGQAFPNASDDIKFVNNILVGPKDKLITSNWNNQNITWEYNILWGGEAKLTGPHDLRVDPEITVERVGDRLSIHIDPRSAAIGSGDPAVPVHDDLFHRPRPKSRGFDRGCLQPPS